jgi:peptidoglycan/LPS O-acetylase OafA/YrhL
LGKNAAAAAGFTANLFYWAESGYFDAEAITKPLLHLWSLGVEEQFYLVWPLFIFLTSRIAKSREAALTVIVLSFAACVLTTAPLSYGAFYSPATRMWELALGGILALSRPKKPAKEAGETTEAPAKAGSSWTREMAAIVGMILILIAGILLREDKPYPGWRALVPTMGAALVIAAGQSTRLNRYILSHPVMVFVGLISYPLYLWHWPLLSLAHIVRLGIVSQGLTIGLTAASVILAAGTYLALEQPLYRVRLNWRLGGELLAAMACVGAFGVAAYLEGIKTGTASPAYANGIVISG